MTKRKQESTVAVISTKHGLRTKTLLGETRKGLSRRHICHLPLFVFLEKFSLILCLNLFGLLADFDSDGRPFHVFGPR